MAADKADTKKPKKRKAQKNRQSEEPEEKGQLSENKVEKGLPRKWKSKCNAEEDMRKDLERRNSTKYRMLKFFEMQKVERKLNTCRKLLLEAKQENRAEDVDALKSKLKAHLADHEYITHYPKHLPYNALFPKEDSEASKRRREEVRKLIQVELAKKHETADDADKREEVVEFEPSRKDDVLKETPKVPAKKAKQSDTKLPAKDSVADKSKATKSKNAKAREKRRLKRNANNVESTSDGKKKQIDDDAPGPEKSSKKTKKKAASLEENESEKASQKGDREPKKRKKESTNENSTVDDTLHPSWHGKKSSKISGALVGSTGKRQTFDSDEE